MAFAALPLLGGLGLGAETGILGGLGSTLGNIGNFLGISSLLGINNNNNNGSESNFFGFSTTTLLVIGGVGIGVVVLVVILKRK